MAFGDYFEHVGPNGVTPLMRMRRTGYISSSKEGFQIAENIAWAAWLGTPRAIVSAWMHSPGHRATSSTRTSATPASASRRTPTVWHTAAGGIYTQDFGIIVG